VHFFLKSISHIWYLIFSTEEKDNCYFIAQTKVCFKGSFSMKKLYVGNLPYNTTEEGLTASFSQHGNVTSVVLIKDRETGRQKGFGFVEFETASQAENALALNGVEFGGRAMKVSLARERTPGAPMGGGDRPRRSSGPRRW
jgi:cold-inducible RNA-binding protein